MESWTSWVDRDLGIRGLEQERSARRAEDGKRRHDLRAQLVGSLKTQPCRVTSPAPCNSRSPKGVVFGDLLEGAGI